MSPQPNETADSVVFNLETQFVKCYRCYEKYQSLWWQRPHDCEVVKRLREQSVKKRPGSSKRKRNAVLKRVPTDRPSGYKDYMAFLQRVRQKASESKKPKLK